MRGTSHLLIGTALSYVICTKFNMQYDIMHTIAAAIGSLLPDIDEEHSIINKHVPLKYKKMIYGIFGVALAHNIYTSKDYSYILPSVLLVLVYLSGHRGFTHSITAGVIFAFILMSDKPQLMAFFIGYMLHLLCDMTNTKGLPLLYPIKRRFRFPINFPATSLLGRAIETSFIAISVYLLLKTIILKYY